MCVTQVHNRPIVDDRAGEVGPWTPYEWSLASAAVFVWFGRSPERGIQPATSHERGIPMQVIRELAEQMWDEVCGAREYAEKALHYRYERPELAATYHAMAKDEYRHMDGLHKEAVEIIRAVKESGVNYPPAMQKRWDDEHARIIDEAAVAKQYIDLWTE